MVSTVPISSHCLRRRDARGIMVACPACQPAPSASSSRTSRGRRAWRNASAPATPRSSATIIACYAKPSKRRRDTSSIRKRTRSSVRSAASGMRSRRRPRPSVPSQNTRGRRTSKSGSGWESTRASPSSRATGISAFPSYAPPGSATRATAVRYCSPLQPAASSQTTSPTAFSSQLGAYELKDFDRPEPITQLVVDGLRPGPPLRTGCRLARRKLALGPAAALLAAPRRMSRSSSSDSAVTSLWARPPSVSSTRPKHRSSPNPGRFKSPLIAAGEGFVWIAVPAGGTLVKIDLETAKSPAGSEWSSESAVRIAAGLGAVWLAVHRDDSLGVLEIGTESVNYGGGPLRRAGRPSRAPGLGDSPWGRDVWAVDFGRRALADRSRLRSSQKLAGGPASRPSRSGTTRVAGGKPGHDQARQRSRAPLSPTRRWRPQGLARRARSR